MKIVHKDSYRVTRAERSDERAWTVERPRGWWRRLKGLIGRRNLPPMTGIWLLPCNGIHTFGMRMAIDVVVLDKDLNILRLTPDLRPFRVILPVRGGHSTLELAAGSIHSLDVQVGDQLEAQRLSSDQSPL